jgi:hypothetical protein
VNASDGGRIEVARQARAGGLVAWVTVDNRAKLNVLGSALTMKVQYLQDGVRR